VSAAGAAALTVVVLALAGLLPVLALVGTRLIALPLSPLAGAVLAAVAAGCCVGVAGSLLTWFVVWSVAAAVVATVVLVLRPGSLRRLALDGRWELRPLVVGAAAVLLAATAWALRTLRVPNIGFDARSIWLLHARWLAAGHNLVSADLRNHFFVVSHPTYPPLVSSVMAMTWVVSGTSTDRAAVVTLALLNGCALFVAGWGVVEAARRAVRRRHADLWRRRVLLGLGVMVAALVVLVAGGVLGDFATNGYADPLWSLAAVGAVLFGLVLQPTASDLGVVVVLLGVAGLSKVEGTAVAIVLLLAIGLRRLLQRDRLVPGVRRVLATMAAGVVALLGWDLLMVIMGVPTDPSISGRRLGSLPSRARTTWNAAVPHLHVLVLAGLCAALGALLLAPLRQKLGLGNDLWAWAALGLAAAVLGGAYVVGPGDTALWLATSVNRTTIFVALLSWWIVAAWALCASAVVLE
jgi:hypothetical protein